MNFLNIRQRFKRAKGSSLPQATLPKADESTPILTGATGADL